MSGVPLAVFTILHVLISLVGILSGLIVIAEFLSGRIRSTANTLFLWTTAAISITGFFFPFHGITPGIIVGIVSLIVLACAVVARSRGASRTYIATACLAEALNVIVLVAQSFQKIPALHGYAPTGNEPVVAAAQLGSLLLFSVLAWMSIRKMKRS